MQPTGPYKPHWIIYCHFPTMDSKILIVTCSGLVLFATLVVATPHIEHSPSDSPNTDIHSLL